MAKKAKDYRITPTFVRKTSEPGRYSDGNGLILIIRPNGGRHWVQRLTVHGRRRDIQIGGYPAVSLARARELARANRDVARAGGDPTRDRSAVPSFRAAAAEVIRLKAPGWKSGKHAKQWQSTLAAYVYPELGDRPVSAITTPDVLAALMPIWHEKHETARRVRQRISAVMKWSMAHGHRPDNPAGDALDMVLPHVRVEVKHRPALHYADVAGAIATVHARGRTYLATRLAFEFLILTAARPGEVREATWPEFDLEGATWTVPASRMKAGREHRVPLSGRALGILREVSGLPQHGPYVFGGPGGAPLSDTTNSKLLLGLGIGAVPHGFRSSFRDWASECTDAPHAVMEAALAHTIKNKAEAAYARSDLFDRRRALMQEWADYLEADDE